MNILPAEWDLSRVDEVVDKSTQEVNNVEFPEADNKTTALQTKNLYKLECANRDSWLLLSGGYIEVKVKITGANVEADSLTEGYKPVLCNDAFHLFSQARLFLENQEIQSINRPGKLHLLNTLVFSSREHVDTVGASKGFFRPTVSTGSSGTTMTTKTNVSTALAREPELNQHNLFWGGVAATTATSNSVYFQLPLSELFSVVGQYSKVMRGAKVRIELQRNTDMSELISAREDADGATANYSAKVVIEEMSLWVPHMKASLETELQLSEWVVSNPVQQVKYANHEYFEQTLPISTNVNTVRLLTDSSRPLYVIMGLQGAKRYSTTNGANHGIHFDSSLFDHFSIDSASCKINSRTYPIEPLIFDSAKRFLRNLDEIHRLGNKLYSHDDAPIIDYNNWKSHYPLVVFNLSGMDQSLFVGINRSDIEIVFKLGDASYSSQTNMIAHFVVGTERVLEIKSTGEKRFSYSRV